jgi:hypothetical protein
MGCNYASPRPQRDGLIVGAHGKGLAGGNGKALGTDHAGALIAPESKPSTARAQAPARRPLSNREYLLAEIRIARQHAALWQSHLDALGVALKANLISPEMAVSELRECGFFHPLVDRPVIAEVAP